MENNIVIGIEGLVGTGKTSICKELLKYIPNAIVLHAGNIYRAITYQIIKEQVPFEKLYSVDLKKLFKYGVHEFYTYPDEAKSQNTENETSEDDTNVVQMVKK